MKKKSEIQKNKLNVEENSEGFAGHYSI